jgi:hypothetical protein
MLPLLKIFISPSYFLLQADLMKPFRKNSDELKQQFVSKLLRNICLPPVICSSYFHTPGAAAWCTVTFCSFRETHTEVRLPVKLTQEMREGVSFTVI